MESVLKEQCLNVYGNSYSSDVPKEVSTYRWLPLGVKSYYPQLA
jgi:hypothetical protein